VAVGDAARRIETENFRLAFPNARFLFAPDLNRGGGGLIAVDADDLVIGATRSARLALGVSRDFRKKPLPAADLLGGSSSARDLDQAERAAVQRALARSDGNVSAAAEALGISRATLHRKLRRLDLHRAH
jgi:transcriptional regulator of acetoin/glycerol metabolism